MKIIFLLMGSGVGLFAEESRVAENGFLYGVIIVLLLIGFMLLRTFVFKKKRVKENIASSQSTNHTTNFEILEKYRLEMRKIKIESQPFRLSGLLHILTNKLSQDIQANAHSIYYDVENSVGRYIIGDNDYIEQVLEIMLKDIISLSSNSEISLKISIHRDKFLMFEVINKDAVMKRDVVKTYIETTRTLSSMSEKLLAYVKAKKIVESMGGAIELKSSRMSGTHYAFKIPYIKDEDNRSNQKELKKFLKGKHALFIGKNEHDSKRAQYIFETFGLGIETMNLSEFETKKPDLSRYDMAILRSQELNYKHISFFKNIYQDKTSDFKIIIVHELFESEDKIALSKEISHAELYNPTIIGDVEEILYQMFMLKSKAVKGINNMEIFNPETFAIENKSEITEEDFEKFKGAHIAIVEDSKVDQRIIKNILTIEGVTLFCLNNGAEMIELLKTEEIDLIFSDINMPVMDGLTMTKKIRSDKKWNNLPIISISSMAFKHEVKEMQSAGMNAAIAKPIIAVEIYQAVKRFLVISPKAKEKRAEPRKISYTYNKEVLNIEKGIEEAGGQLQYIEILTETMEILDNTTDDLAKMIRDEEYRALSAFATSALALYDNMHAGEMVKMFRELAEYLSVKEKTYIMDYIFLYKKNWRMLEIEIDKYLNDVQI
ncbi:MAG: response regulator [Sulfurovum sp.]|nr:response regulator [Sulfurovum sp.]